MPLLEAVVHPTGVEIRVGSGGKRRAGPLQYRTRRPVRLGRFVSRRDSGSRPTFLLGRRGGTGGQAMPEQYREGIQVSFCVSLGLL